MKNILGGAVLVADILFGMAAPQVIKNLHHETRPHLYWAVAVYAVLALATLWVVMSVAGTASAGKKPAPRAGYPFSGSR